MAPAPGELRATNGPPAITGAVLGMGRLGLVGAGPQPREEAEARGDEAAAGLPFDDVRFESRLVWILGSPRTGSTWLERVMTGVPSGTRSHREM